MSTRLSQFIAQENSEQQISVVVPAIDAASRITKAVQSALNQTYPVLEVIVVDDDSEDETSDLVSSLARKDPRVHYTRHPFKRGIHTALNSGIRNAQGNWIAFINPEDEWHLEKIEKQVEVIFNSPFLPGVIGCGYREVPSAGQPVREHRYQLRGHVYKELLANYGPGPTSILLVKKGVLEEAGGFDERARGYYEWELCLRLSQHSLFDGVPEPLVEFNPQARNITGSGIGRTVQAYLDVVSMYQHEIQSECGSGTYEEHKEHARKRYLWHAGQFLQQRDYARASKAFQLAGKIPPKKSGLILRALALRALPHVYGWFYSKKQGIESHGVVKHVNT